MMDSIKYQISRLHSIEEKKRLKIQHLYKTCKNDAICEQKYFFHHCKPYITEQDLGLHRYIRCTQTIFISLTYANIFADKIY